MADIAYTLPCAPLKKSDFNYELPPELIAQAPLAERSGPPAPPAA
jgi:S-adenosylmethionine:tRNA ribosyltransferase-isomerase